MQELTLTVSQLNDYVRRSLASDPILQHITLRGEISNFKAYTSGHWYFTLKDENSRIDCALFRQYTMGVRFRPQDGMQVLVTGSAGLYVQGGKYQFYADGMRREGVGELYQRYLELKDRLMREGLFDVSRKRPLPLLPRKVGIVTSLSGAVQHDIRTVAGRRFPGLPLVLRPAQVQGEGAAEDVARGILQVSSVPGVDVVIVGRGGGSMEDLWAFNEEVVVRAVAACPVPVISAVGHETDTTLCDFAADMRAPTPSAAAELAVPEREALLAVVEERRKAMLRATGNAVLSAGNALAALQSRLLACHPRMRVQGMLAQTEKQQVLLRSLIGKQVQLLRQQVVQLGEKLQAAGPRQALERGYAIALQGKKVITSVTQARDEMKILFRDGCAQVRVISSEEGDPFGGEEGKKL